MKKLILTLTFILLLTLTGCNKESKLDYGDFYEHKESSYYLSETESIGRYVLYYYDSTDENSKLIKDDILQFFDTFTTLDFYMLDTSKVQSESSSFANYDGEPVIYVVSSRRPLETYKGAEQIRIFIDDYSNIRYDYDLFEEQHITSVDEITNTDQLNYLVYFYSDTCGFCEELKEEFLTWAFTRSVSDIYFINSANSEVVSNLPEDLLFLLNGTPQLVIMSEGVFTGEKFVGNFQITDYILLLGSNEITSDFNNFDYSDFSEHMMDSYDDSLIISDNVHIEYYYSIYCGFCNSIKSQVLNFFNDNDDLEYYILNTAGATGLIRIDDFTGVPALYIIADNVVVAQYLGALAIPQFINDYNNGDIDLTQYE